jgi:hypothetical protein
MAIIPRSKLRLLFDDYCSLVAAGILQGTLYEAEQFVCGYLAQEAESYKSSADRLRLIVLSDFGQRRP